MYESNLAPFHIRAPPAVSTHPPFTVPLFFTPTLSFLLFSLLLPLPSDPSVGPKLERGSGERWPLEARMIEIARLITSLKCQRWNLHWSIQIPYVNVTLIFH